jgi:membrane protease YdiL (CAAX protease family)
MLANQLTQPVSKKLLFGLLIVTIGADLALFLSRESYFMEMIYSNIMLFSILIAVKLAPRLKDNTVVVSKTKVYSTFVKAFFLLYLVGTINNYYSSQIFPEFSENRSALAEDFSTKVDSYEERMSSDSAEYTRYDRVVEWVDSVGYDIYDYFLAGLEEVWRFSYILLFLMLFKKLMPHLWERSSKNTFMIVAILLSSLLFGVGHSLAYEQSWTVFVGTVVSYTNIGVILGYLLIYTRNLWLLVLVHGLYNVLKTMGWTYFEWATEVFVALLLLINGVVWIVGKIRANMVEAKGFEL